MSKPDFLTLEALPNRPEFRKVAGTWMDREQFDVEGWHVVGQHPSEHGEVILDWKAELDGLQRYGRLIRQRSEDRKRSWQERNAADDEFTAYINALDDAKPTR